MSTPGLWQIVRIHRAWCPRAIRAGCVFVATVMLFDHIGRAAAAMLPAHGAAVGRIAVPKDPQWAKYVLLAVIWTLVIAAVIGPMYRFFQRKTTPPDIIKYRGW